jgi:ABC-type lipoprotein export system ATPase subunit
MLDKQRLRLQLLDTLTRQRDVAFTAASDAHNDATHEQSVAETQYDTVGLEAAYLAHGQSQRVAEFDAMITQLKGLALRDFDDMDEIAIGAIVTLDDQQTFWLLPMCGGYKLEQGAIIVVTPHAPLGKMLNGAGLEETLNNGRTVTNVQ